MGIFFQERLVPLEMPETICGCLRVSSSVIAGQSIVVVTMNGKKNFMGLGGGVTSVEVSAEFHPQLFADHILYLLPLTLLQLCTYTNHEYVKFIHVTLCKKLSLSWLEIQRCQ